MKRLSILILIACMLCMTLACAKQSAEPEPVPAVTAPGEREVKLTLPLSSRSDVAESLSGYAAEFAAASGAALLYSVRSSDETVATGVLGDDGTLYVIAHGVGDAKLTVIAATLTGEQGTATVSVKVFDARRTLALIVLGVLAVALLILFGKPVRKDSSETPAVTAESEPEVKESEYRKE